MKNYTYEETRRFIEELESGRNDIQTRLSELREKRNSLKLWDVKGKKEIDNQIEDLTFNSTCHSYSILMLQMYEDSIRPKRGMMDTETLIKCEKEAESGDGMSKLIIFCHKCFIEHTIVERDLKRLEMEASEGNYSSAYILFGYNMFFAN